MITNNATFFSLIPIVIILLIAEIIYSYKENKELYESKDTVNNLLIGLVYVITNSLSRITFYAAICFVSQWKIVSFGNAWWVWVLCFFANDFTFYIYHKSAHEINWFWASHAVHHSSEKLNISTALRQSWTTNLTGHFVFWLWMPIAGFSPDMIMIVAQVSLFYQYLLHTETVGKLPHWIEYLFNTPSHHRVHHGSNSGYIDKNHGGVLIIWDRIFGTFCEEKEKPRYGLKDRAAAKNFGLVVFSEWKELFNKVRNAGSFKKSLFYLIKKPGWMPSNDAKDIKPASDLKEVSMIEQRASPYV